VLCGRERGSILPLLPDQHLLQPRLESHLHLKPMYDAPPQSYSSDNQRCRDRRRGSPDRKLVVASLRHPSGIRDRSGNQWSYYRGHSLAFDSEAGLSSRPLVIIGGKVWPSLELSALPVVIGRVMT
jgi:hypothetical protein